MGMGHKLACVGRHVKYPPGKGEVTASDHVCIRFRPCRSRSAWASSK